MAGAAAVLATVTALPALAAIGSADGSSGGSAVFPYRRVTAVLCLAENMAGGAATRPGDVIRIWDGTTVEVLNTDAEGRLVLADGLSYAAATQAPDVLLDIATLTGAVSVALGRRTAGLFASSDTLADDLSRAAGAAGERVWRLPLTDDYEPALGSDVADVANIARKVPVQGGSIVAGLFLRRFTRGLPWAHLDIAGTGRSDSDDGEISKGGTGWGVRTLLSWLAPEPAPGRE
jgi:leucyl aminopeptidase